MSAANPFFCGRKFGYGTSYYLDAQSRIYAVRNFDTEQCRAALKVAGLQKTVRIAVERRLRALAKN